MNMITRPDLAVETRGNFVDGREIEAGDGPLIDVRNPATGAVIARIPNSTEADVTAPCAAPAPPSSRRNGAAWTLAPAPGW